MHPLFPPLILLFLILFLPHLKRAIAARMDRRYPWTKEDDRSWRWRPAFAFRPVKTFDRGWIWCRPYSRWQCSWGWGFFDDYPYVDRKVRERSIGPAPKPKRDLAIIHGISCSLHD